MCSNKKDYGPMSATDKLIAKIKLTNCPIVVGLDTAVELIPDYFFPKGIDTDTSAQAQYLFNIMLIDEIHEHVPAVKINFAFYERYGLAGLESMYATAKYAKECGLMVIGDAKRSDIGNSSKEYAKAYLESASYFDFLTVNPYMGRDSIEPFIDVCKESGKGIFVLVKTSNKGSADYQNLSLQGETSLYERVAKDVAKWGAPLIGDYGFSQIGAVVGATHPDQAAELRLIMPHTPILVPGYGAQGGSAADVVPNFNKDGIGAIVNASRSILGAWKSERWKGIYSPQEYPEAALAEIIHMKKEINTALELR